jgi:hypothetical protein
MGRFTDMDDVTFPRIRHMITTNKHQDIARLPEGMQRIGYDADTQRYSFRDQDGSLWESATGNRYGELRPVGQASSGEDVEAMNVMIEEDEQSAMRTMLPFGILIFLFLLGVFKLVDR